MLRGVRALRRRFEDSARSFGQVFANPNIRRIEGAWAASIIAHWAYGIALAVYAYRDGGAAAVGLVGLVRFLPSAVASPFASVLGDRYRRERVIFVAELARAVLLAATTAVVVLEGSPVVVYVLAGLVAIAYSAVRPAQAALLPTVAKTPQELTAANVTSSTIESLGIFGGPAIGGVLLAATSEQVVFGATAAAFLLAAILVSRVRVETQPEPRERRDAVWHEFTAGFVTIFREPGLRVLVALLAAQTFVAGALNVLIVVTALQLLDLGEDGVGFLNSAVGIGGLIGAIVSALLIGRRLSSNFLIGIVLWGIPIGLIGVFPNPLIALLLLAVVGLGNTLVDVSAFTLLQRAVPDEVLARAFGAVQGLWVATIGIGSIVAPLLIAAVDIRGALMITGALLPILATLLRRRLAQLDAVPVPERELELLRGIELFAPLPQPTQESLAQVLSPVRLASSEELFRQGDVGDRFYIVADGDVEIVIDGRVVRETVPGGYFGEISLLRDVPRTATVRGEGRRRALCARPRRLHRGGHGTRRERRGRGLGDRRPARFASPRDGLRLDVFRDADPEHGWAVAEVLVQREHVRIRRVVGGDDRPDSGLRRPADRCLLRQPGKPSPAKVRRRAGHLVRRTRTLPVGDEPGEGGRPVAHEHDGAQVEIELGIAERLGEPVLERHRVRVVVGHVPLGGVVQLEELAFAIAHLPQPDDGDLAGGLGSCDCRRADLQFPVLLAPSLLEPEPPGEGPRVRLVVPDCRFEPAGAVPDDVLRGRLEEARPEAATAVGGQHTRPDARDPLRLKRPAQA